jgi:hypothetical protein
MPQVKLERSNWRDPGLENIAPGTGIHSCWDKEFSHRHRTWGWNSPAVDIDYLICSGGLFISIPGEMIMLEYNNAKAKVIVDYKRVGAPPISGANKEALLDLSLRAGLPFLEVYYSPDYTHFVVICHTYSELSRESLTEEEYIAYVHELRGL